MRGNVDDRDPVIAMRKSVRGFASRLAREIGITRQAVHSWKRVPPRHALAIAKFMNLHPHEVCPEMYPPPRRPRGDTRIAASNR